MLLGPFACLALLLVAAGLAKMRAPAATGAALAALGVPMEVSAIAARALGAVEVGVGSWAVLGGGRNAAVTVAMAHLGFAGVTTALLRRPHVPCGCFGAPDAPATTTGLVSNLVSATVAGLAAIWPPSRLVDAVAAQPLIGATLVVLVVLGAWLVHEVHAAHAVRTAAQ